MRVIRRPNREFKMAAYRARALHLGRRADRLVVPEKERADPRRRAEMVAKAERSEKAAHAALQEAG